MSEIGTMKQVMLAVTERFPKITKIFRNNTGLGWVGKSKSYQGHVVIKDARPLHAGLCEGSSDLVGWTEKIVTPGMIGTKVAIFTALEVKSEHGKTSAKQLNFLQKVAEAGGIAGICRSPEHAIKIISDRLSQ